MFTVSNVGSAPLFARRNLPSLLPSPCGSLARVTAWSAIFAVVIPPSASFDPAIAAFVFISALTMAA